MKTVCDLDMCSGCKSCISVCSKKAITFNDEVDSLNCIINTDLCNDCGACRKVCPTIKPPELLEQVVCYQGWTNDDELRSLCSSGGVASSIIKKFLENNGYVASCVHKDGDFKFEIINNPSEYMKFKGSKYVKSNPNNIYLEILNMLKKDEKVLFVGLPCQVAALKKRVPDKFQDKLYTIDLICHGTPSIKCLEKYLEEVKYKFNSIKKICFREKNLFRISVGNSNKLENKITDSYTLSFLKGLNYTNNCYECNYAQIKRASDITLGDSWGSKLDKEEKENGISLILCQSKKGKELVLNSNLHLNAVDFENAVIHNQQLVHPSIKPKHREWFFKHLKNNDRQYRHMIFLLYPIDCLKQFFKFFYYKCKQV